MSQYNSIRLEHLIKLCCWTNKVEPSKEGFEILEKNLEKHLRNGSLIKVKYLQNLWSETKACVKSQQPIIKQDDYINQLLDFCGFHSWLEFEEEITKIESFIREYPSLSTFEEISIAVLTSEREIHDLLPFIGFHGKIIDLRVELNQASSEKIAELNDILESKAYVVSYFSPKGEECDIHPIEPDSFASLTSTNRFVPVWSGKNGMSYTIEGIARHQQIIGFNRLILCLLVLNDAKDKAGIQKSGSFLSQKATPSQKIKNFKGIIANGDLNMTGGNLSLGDTNNYSEKK